MFNSVSFLIQLFKSTFNYMNEANSCDHKYNNFVSPKRCMFSYLLHTTSTVCLYKLLDCCRCWM